MEKCDFDKYTKSGAIHWTAISRNVNSHGLAFDARYRTCVNLLQDIFDSKKNLSILDLGCGDGALSYYLRKAFPEAILTGIDGSEDGIRLAHTFLAKYSISNVELMALDFENIVSLTAQYDIVISLDVIEHVQDANQFLVNIRNLLRDDGHIILSTPIRLREFPKDKDHYKEFFPNELKTMIEEARFEVIKHTQIIPIYLLIRYFNPTKFFIGKSKIYKKVYNMMNIFFNYNIFLKKAPSASYELYETQFIMAVKGS